MEKAMILQPGFVCFAWIVMATIITIAMVNRERYRKYLFTSMAILILAVGAVCGLLYGKLSILPIGQMYFIIVAALLALIGAVAFGTRKSTQKARMHLYSLSAFSSVTIFYAAVCAVHSVRLYMNFIN